MYAVRGDEGVEFGVVELATVVHLYEGKRQIKLSLGECAKQGKRSVGIRFLA